MSFPNAIDLEPTGKVRSALVTPVREWQASLQLMFAHRRQATRITHNQHLGPLRVLKPFYPEGEVCHTYLIHPPGGLVLGDALAIDIRCQRYAHALLTTPSAGKVYGVDEASELQRQGVTLSVEKGACIEWLPQETIIFDGANCVLNSRIDLQKGANLAFWDIVCFGRPASQLPFKRGRCVQAINIYQDGCPLLVERNVVAGGAELQAARWGLNHFNSMGTCLFTVASSRDEREEWLRLLSESYGIEHHWGITQKGHLLIARYLGDSASVCRQGFEMLWQKVRMTLCARPAHPPRIWAT